VGRRAGGQPSGAPPGAAAAVKRDAPGLFLISAPKFGPPHSKHRAHQPLPVYTRPARSGSASSRQEGLALPKADPGSGSVDLVAGVGYLPALQVGWAELNGRGSSTAAGQGVLALLLGARGGGHTSEPPMAWPPCAVTPVWGSPHRARAPRSPPPPRGPRPPPSFPPLPRPSPPPPKATYESLYSQVTAPSYKPNGPLSISIAALPALLALYRCARPPPVCGCHLGGVILHNNAIARSRFGPLLHLFFTQMLAPAPAITSPSPLPASPLPPPQGQGAAQGVAVGLSGQRLAARRRRRSGRARRPQAGPAVVRSNRVCRGRGRCRRGRGCGVGGLKCTRLESDER
jgi:hypothetical protein